MNHPPDIVSPSGWEDGLELVIGADETVATVIATDPDTDDVIWVDWRGIPPDIAIAQESTAFPMDHHGKELWLSYYKVPYDERLEGRTLTAEVSDLDGDNTITIRWTMRVEDQP